METRAYLALLRYIEIRKARAGDYGAFIRLMHPDPKDPDDVRKCNYDFQPAHDLMIEEINKVLRGDTRNLILTTPPRLGKTEVCARMLMAFTLGIHPNAENIYGSYGAGLSSEIARDVITIMDSPMYHQVFPEIKLTKRSDQAIRTNSTRGRAVFAGRGTALTGKGVGNGGVLVLDDLFKDAKEADSEVTRESAWQWAVKVAMSRRINDKVPMILVFTRWSEDDVIGRIINEDSIYYNESLAKSFRYVNLPAESLGKDVDPLHRPEGESIWPSRFSRDYLAEMRNADARAYSALYMGNPSPVDGVYFTREDVHKYTLNERPPLADLAIYGATDYAITESDKADYTVHIVVGVDAYGQIWVLDMFRKRANAEAIIDAKLKLMDKWKPQMWFAEKGHISKSLAPFMRKRMQEEGIFIAVRSITPIGDKAQRGRSFQGRFNQGLVRIPAFLPWGETIIAELLGFQAGAAHDDIVDTFSLIGLALDAIHGKRSSEKVIPMGTKRIAKNRRGSQEGWQTMNELKAETKQQEAKVINLKNRGRF